MKEKRKHITISIVTPCFNEEANIEALHSRVKEIFSRLSNYDYEHIFIDNASIDRTPAILRALAAMDSRVKIIFNLRNFGHIRSPYYGLLQAQGQVAILLAADFQDPPDLIVDFIKKWEKGYRVVLGVKTTSGESPFMFAIRKYYYRFLARISDIHLTENTTGFGLYDRIVLEALRKLDDPYPYLRGLLNYLGFEYASIEYHQPERKRGKSKNNFYSLYDVAMLGIVNHSKVPLRLATLAGFMMSAASLFVAGLIFVLKLAFWEKFTFGIAPILISLYFFSSVLLFFVGMVGEYVAAIHTQVQRRPLVIEKERINFNVTEMRKRRVTDEPVTQVRLELPSGRKRA